MNMPLFDSVNFPQWLDTDSQAPFNGFESSLNGFFIECQLYFRSLLDPKLKERQWLGIMLSQFIGSVWQWVELLIATGNFALGSVAEFVCLLRVIYRKGDFNFNVENVFGDGQNVR